jgi:hypothetical protein
MATSSTDSGRVKPNWGRRLRVAALVVLALLVLLTILFAIGTFNAGSDDSGHSTPTKVSSAWTTGYGQPPAWAATNHYTNKDVTP